MYQLIQSELLKIRKAKIIYVTIVLILLIPISILMASLLVRDIDANEFRQLSILIFSLFGSRILIPFVGMKFILIETENKGFTSNLTTPISFNKFILAKIVASSIIAVFLVTVFILYLVLCEVLNGYSVSFSYLFQNMYTFLLILFYSVCNIILGMLLISMVKSIKLTGTIIVLSMLMGYILRLYQLGGFLPMVIPEYIIGRNVGQTQLFTALTITTVFMVVSCILIRYFIVKRFK